ncbi:methylamine dehydrogenase light chain [Luminiphilus syltensis NOR5-1B]|uniref:Methylamine dehydrogenase light chain n=1 Tax=Luminiphilus syltensis NOR5-1B TaxID=565045 RepID=B8KXQ9_9GAMM|nr:methylamine dehydrogenase light chain [Luminiphilus syltensis]EED35222.1 methylamine dehydrogenase light chain [Luminiphilus syltensis NOR5-1B]
MTKPLDLARLSQRLDQRMSEAARRVAQRTSRRSFLGKLGLMLAGASFFPLLPVRRAFGNEPPQDLAAVSEIGDPQSCDYWRYCALGGSLCSCCGGSATTCPPGSEPSPISWIGTCHNPADGKDYLISYNDCCGKSYCERCVCHRTERDKPVYFPAKSNDILWCFGTESQAYHCTVSLVLGEAEID